MNVPIKLFIALICLSLSAVSHAFPELPFCPAGGPPGWMNHFINKRDQNIWLRRYQNPPPLYRQPANVWPIYRNQQAPTYYQPYNYFAPPYTQQPKNYYRRHPRSY